MRLSNNQKVFFALLNAGLWEKELRLSSEEDLCFGCLQQFAENQAVVGLIAAGLEHTTDVKLPIEEVLRFVGQTLLLEQRNEAMNRFICVLIEKMRKVGIYSLLVKGQGIAQCYERPLWRDCGDVDLFLGEDNYKKALRVLSPLATSIDEENTYNKHIAMVIDGWSVELHGTLRGSIKRINRVIDEVQNDVFYSGYVRSWMNGNTQVFLPRVDEDVFFVFVHILQHFYIEGIGLRQICDWSRLLYTYRESLDYKLLESRIRKAGIMTEWKAFGAFAVEYLGLPTEVMPFLNSLNVKEFKKFKRKADKILNFVMESGNFGHKRDISYKQKYPFIIRYAMSLGLYTKLAFQRFAISPRNAFMAWWAIVKNGANAAAKAI